MFYSLPFLGDRRERSTALFVQRAGRAAEQFLCSGGFLHRAGMNQLVAEFVSTARGFPASARLWLVFAVLAFAAHAVCSKGTVFRRSSHEFFIISTFYPSFLLSCTTVGYFASVAAGDLTERRGALAACSPNR